MKQALARILCLSTVLLLLNGIVFSFLSSEKIIPTNNKNNETKLSQKNDGYSMLFNENEEADSFDDDDENEKEFHTVQLFVSTTIKLYYSLHSNIEIIHCCIPEKPTLKPVQIWLQTRKLII